MSGRRLPWLFPLLAAVALGALVALVVGLRLDDRQEVTPPAGNPEGIEARGVLSDRTPLFGDTVTASVDVTLDRDLVDPDSVRVAARFHPWGVVGAPRHARHDAGTTTSLQTTYVLRCVTSPCLPGELSRRLELTPARVVYGAPGGPQTDRSTIRVEWPPMVVYSRFALGTLDRQPATSPWRADLVTLPEVSYRVAPAILRFALLAGSLVFALAGLALAWIAWPVRTAPEPEPEPEPTPALTPFEQALVFLESRERTDGGTDQRRALELVAEELELADWGDAVLARTARSLAWSEHVPSVEDTRGLAARVRAALVLLDEGEDARGGSGVG